MSDKTPGLTGSTYNSRPIVDGKAGPVDTVKAKGQGCSKDDKHKVETDKEISLKYKALVDEVVKRRVNK